MGDGVAADRDPVEAAQRGPGVVVGDVGEDAAHDVGEVLVEQEVRRAPNSRIATCAHRTWSTCWPTRHRRQDQDVAHVEAQAAEDQVELLDVAAVVDRRRRHPLADAVVDELARERAAPVDRVDEAEVDEVAVDAVQGAAGPRAGAGPAAASRPCAGGRGVAAADRHDQARDLAAERGEEAAAAEGGVVEVGRQHDDPFERVEVDVVEGLVGRRRRRLGACRSGRSEAAAETPAARAASGALGRLVASESALAIGSDHGRQSVAVGRLCARDERLGPGGRRRPGGWRRGRRPSRPGRRRRRPPRSAAGSARAGRAAASASAGRLRARGPGHAGRPTGRPRPRPRSPRSNAGGRGPVDDVEDEARRRVAGQGVDDADREIAEPGRAAVVQQAGARRRPRPRRSGRSRRRARRGWPRSGSRPCGCGRRTGRARGSRAGTSWARSRGGGAPSRPTARTGSGAPRRGRRAGPARRAPAAGARRR